MTSSFLAFPITYQRSTTMTKRDPCASVRSGLETTHLGVSLKRWKPWGDKFRGSKVCGNKWTAACWRYDWRPRSLCWGDTGSFWVSESDKDDDVDRKWFHPLKAHNRTSSKRFKCFLCDRRYDAISKLKRHRISHSGCLHQSDSEENLHPKPEINADRSDNELPSEGVCTDDLSNSSLQSVERSNDDDNLVVLHVAGFSHTQRTYTNTRGFELSVVNNRKSQTQVVLQALYITPQSDP